MGRNSFLWPLLALLLLVGSAASAQDKSSSSEAKPAFVSGMVNNSLTGEPLAHAHVLLVRQEGDGPDAYGAMTNVDGRFSIKPVAPGSYFLTATHRGYGPVEGFLFLVAVRSPRLVTVKAGEELKDLGIPLVPDAVISGRVVDSEGSPVEGVEVEAISSGPPHSGQTDDRGEFRIGGLLTGRYVVKANPDRGPMPPEIRTDGSVEINFGVTYYPSSPVARSAAPVIVRAGQETNGIEIKLAPARVLHISGDVAFSGKSAGVSVMLEGEHGGRSLYAGPDRSLYAGPDHKFTFWRVPPGRYQVVAESMDDSNKQVRTAPAEINLTTTSIEGIHLTLVPAMELNGRVQFQEEGAIADAETRPSVTLKPLGELNQAEQNEEVDAQNRFKMAEVFPGRYHVIVGGLAKNFYVKSVRLNDAEFDDGILDLRRPPAKPVLTIHIAADGAAVSGVVRRQDQPAAAASVALFFDDEYGFDLADSTETEAGGTYSFHGITPGKYKLLAYDPGNSGDVWSSAALALYDSVTEKIEVSAGDKISVDLKLLP